MPQLFGVFGAATRLLDRYALPQDQRDLSLAPVDDDAVTRSLLMFRLGEEWLGLTTRSLVEVAPLQPIHSLPHQRSRALLGVANVRGALVACLSLVELLDLEPGAAVVSGARGDAAHVDCRGQGWAGGGAGG